MFLQSVRGRAREAFFFCPRVQYVLYTPYSTYIFIRTAVLVYGAMYFYIRRNSKEILVYTSNMYNNTAVPLSQQNAHMKKWFVLVYHVSVLL